MLYKLLQAITNGILSKLWCRMLSDIHISLSLSLSLSSCLAQTERKRDSRQSDREIDRQTGGWQADRQQAGGLVDK